MTGKAGWILKNVTFHIGKAVHKSFNVELKYLKRHFRSILLKLLSVWDIKKNNNKIKKNHED